MQIVQMNKEQLNFASNILQPQIRLMKYFCAAWAIMSVALKNNFLNSNF